ncbi:MAG: type IV pilin protein [Rubrivivax sp.]|jgi:type IV pilus assembly protein PilE
MRPASAAGRGFSLVELAVVLAAVGVLVSLAVPSWQQHLQRARRADAVAALTQLQAAQERLRTHTGAYSNDFQALQRPLHSAEGHYTLAVELQGPEAYRATATPRAGGPQQPDSACSPLVMQVRLGFVETGPQRGCWQR